MVSGKFNVSGSAAAVDLVPAVVVTAVAVVVIFFTVKLFTTRNTWQHCQMNYDV